MKIFDSKGRIRIPDNTKKLNLQENEKLAITECYCKNGHNLINSRAQFNGLPGILIKVYGHNGRGFLALSPVWGDKSKISVDIDLIENELLHLCCPLCDEVLVKYSHCECGGEMVTLFLDKKQDFSNCIGICNRYGCPHSEIKNSQELLYHSRKHTL